MCGVRIFSLLVAVLLAASSVYGDESVFISDFVTRDGGNSWSGDGGLTWRLAPKVTPDSIAENDVIGTKDGDDVTGTKDAVSDMKGEFLWMLTSLVRDLESTTAPIKPLPGKYRLQTCSSVSSTGEVTLCDALKR